jgi:hypothetical protein
VFQVAPAGATGTAQNSLATFAEMTSARAFNLYNTFTDASNYERGFLSWSRETNTLFIGTEGAGTGSDTRSVKIRSAGRTYDFTGLGMLFSASVPNTNHGISGTNATHFFGTGSSFVFSGSGNNVPLEIRTNNVARVRLDTVGSLRLLIDLTVATLPSSPLVGMMARVTDADSPTVGSTVVGSGAAAALVWYNGANWTVIGV